MKKTLLLVCALSIGALSFPACSNAPEGTTDGDCSDSKDNDKNGFIDCEDVGCQLDDYCIGLAAKAKAAADAAAEATKSAAEKAAGVPDDPNALHIPLEKIWVQKGQNGTDVTFSQAKKYCDDLILEEKGDWRLPTSEEAVTAVQTGKIPSESLVMWTSSQKKKKTAYIVGISTGAVNEISVHSKGQCRARCVRDNK